MQQNSWEIATCGSHTHNRKKKKDDDAAAAAAARVDVRDFSRQRPKTGEEGAYELDDDGEVGDGKLGLTSKEDLARIVSGLRSGSRLFEDPDFPADETALFFSKRSREEVKQVRGKGALRCN